MARKGQRPYVDLENHELRGSRLLDYEKCSPMRRLHTHLYASLQMRGGQIEKSRHE